MLLQRRQLRIHIFNTRFRGPLAVRVGPGEPESNPNDTRGKETVRPPGHAIFKDLEEGAKE